MSKIKAAAIQMKCSTNPKESLSHAEEMVREAAANGANVILLPELFEREYFCQQRRYDFYQYAKTVEENKAVQMGKRLAKELQVVLPISFYEKDVNNLYNSVACIDADGTLLGVYRKTHIPDDHYYQEKFYFTPGDTGFKAFKTRYGTIGIGICWDQWFPETARSMALLGAEILLYPTAIGSEPILECDRHAALETRHAGSCGSKSDASHSSKPNWNRNSRAMRRKWWPDICIKFLWFIIHCRRNRRAYKRSITRSGRNSL